MELILDTTFLIDLEREQAKPLKATPAKDFITQNQSATYFITLITVGEFAEGFESDTSSDFQNYLAPFSIIGIDQEVSWIYGQITKDLRKNKKLIGTNDLWIAAIAIRNNKAIVTRNSRDFLRVEELEVVDY